MDFSYIEKYWPMYIEAGKLTLYIGSIGIILSAVVGIICSAIEYKRIPILRRIVDIYVELSRNTPLLVQLFFLYFGLPKIGIRWSAEVCAVVGLAFLGGSYMTEAFRSGLETVDKIQHETAFSLGLTEMQTMVYVILPQAIAVSVPSLVSNVIFLLKETSVFSGIALMDLMFVAKDLIGLHYQTEEALCMLVVAYLIILLPISILGTIIERRVRYAGFGT